MREKRRNMTLKILKNLKKLMTDTEKEKVKVKIPSLVTVKKFAELLGLGVTDVIKELMKNKILATINDEIDYDTAAVRSRI